MGLSERLPLKPFSEKFICHVLKLSACQWFFKCILHFLPCSHTVRCWWWGSTRNATYVRRENAHPANVQHVSWGRDQLKQIARGKKMSPCSDHWQRVKDWRSQMELLRWRKQSLRAVWGSQMGKGLHSATKWSTNRVKWSLPTSVGALRNYVFTSCCAT